MGNFKDFIKEMYQKDHFVDSQLGTSPYDAIPDILYRHQKRFSYRLIRCTYDIAVTIIAFSLGARIGVVTIVMGFTLGPVISLVGKWISPLIENV